MKKRVVKLTESDLEKLVKRIIKESDEDWLTNTYGEDLHTEEEMNYVWDKLNRMNSDIVFERMEKTFNEESMSVESFVDCLPTHFGLDEDYLISVLKQIQKEGI
jgi:hypothetical protein